MPWFVLLNYTVSVTRVITLTLAHTDGEMFVSHDYNYNHSVILKLNSVVFDWPACWNQFTVLLCIFSNLIGNWNLNVPFFLWPWVDSWDVAADWPKPSELIFILACLGLEVMMPTAARDWWEANTSGGNELWPLKSSTWRKIDISV